MTLALTAAGAAVPAGAAADSGSSSGSGSGAGEAASSTSGRDWSGDSGEMQAGAAEARSQHQGAATAGAAHAQATAQAQANVQVRASAQAQAAAQGEANAQARAAAQPQANAAATANAEAQQQANTQAQARPARRSWDGGADKPQARPATAGSPARQDGAADNASGPAPAAPQRPTPVDEERNGAASPQRAPEQSSAGESRDHGDKARQRGRDESTRRPGGWRDDSPRTADRPGAESPRNPDRSHGSSPDSVGKGSTHGGRTNSGPKNGAAGGGRKHGGSDRGKKRGDSNRGRNRGGSNRGHGHSHGTPGPSKPHQGGTPGPRPKPREEPVGSVPGTAPPVGPSASPPVRPIVVSTATLSRLTPTAAATAAPASPPRTGRATKQSSTGPAHDRPAARVLSGARAATRGGYAWGRLARDHLVNAGRAVTDVDRLADVGTPIRTAPLLVAVPGLTMQAENGPLATPQKDRSPSAPPSAGARVGEIAAAAAHRIRDALVYGLLVGLTVFLAGYALARARLRFLAASDAAAGRGGVHAASGTTFYSRPEVATFISAANGAGPPVPEPSSATTRPPAAGPVAVPRPEESPDVAADAGPTRSRRRHAR